MRWSRPAGSPIPKAAHKQETVVTATAFRCDQRRAEERSADGYSVKLIQPSTLRGQGDDEIDQKRTAAAKRLKELGAPTQVLAPAEGDVIEF